MTQNPSHPSELRLVSAGKRLEVEWDDGGLSALSAERLRAASRAADTVSAQAAGREPDRPAAVTITDIEMIGAYAVRLFFSDGHDRGIYPWRYLRELGAA